MFREDYERELACLRQLLSPGAVVVDVGASVGIYALVAARLAGEGGAVLAFEPTAESFTFLEQNVHMNHLRNVRTLPIALSSRSGQARIYHHADSSRNSLGRADSAGADSEEVRTEPLDLILEQEGIRRLDFLKMDVEGAEELVLLGADDILRRARPAILFEVNPVAANHLGLRGDGAWRLLENRGYLFYEATSNGRLQSLHSPPEGGNVIAIHQDRSGLPTSL